MGTIPTVHVRLPVGEGNPPVGKAVWLFLHRDTGATGGSTDYAIGFRDRVGVWRYKNLNGRIPFEPTYWAPYEGPAR